MNSTSVQKKKIIEEMNEYGLTLPYSDDLSYYKKPLSIYGKEIPVRIGIQPLEGFDSDLNGSPTDIVYRRYTRFAKGGAGLIWFEACAVSNDGKSNPHQMSLADSNVNEFRKLIQAMDQASAESCHKPAFKVLQLTHSGRMSRDNHWNPLPLAARKNRDEGEISYLASDERIKKMVDEHIHAAILAQKAGFDAVDIKVCHGYFMSELLSAYDRPGMYGGCFENRTRALFEIIDGINASTNGSLAVTVRLNAFDSVPFPYGYGIVKTIGDEGTSKSTGIKADLTEAVRICQLLGERGVELINISASSPSESLFCQKPSNPDLQKYVSSTDLLQAVRLIKEKTPGITFMCTGLSTFSDLGAEIGSGGIKDGWFDIAGFGRQALAYPDFANDILTVGEIKKEKCCVACDSCFKLMDPGRSMTGCIVRDSDIYLPVYKRNVLNQ